MNWSDYWVLIAQIFIAIIVLTVPAALSLQLVVAAFRRSESSKTARIL